MKDNINYYGFLLKPISEFNVMPDLNFCSDVSDISYENKGDFIWQSMFFHSRVPLVDPEKELPPFTYKILWHSTNKYLTVASSTTSVVNKFLDTCCPQWKQAYINRPFYISIDDFVKNYIFDDGEFYKKYKGMFYLKFAHIKTPAFGKRMTSLSMYGEDLTGTSFCRISKNIFTFTNIGLKLDINSYKVLSIDNEGSLSFKWYGDEKKLSDIGYILNFFDLNEMLR